MRENPNITIPELTKSLGLSSGGTEKNIRQLRTEKKIIRIGSNIRGHWEALDNG